LNKEKIGMISKEDKKVLKPFVKRGCPAELRRKVESMIINSFGLLL